MVLRLPRPLRLVFALALAPALALLSGCEDDPAALSGCAVPHACEVEGPDLAIEALTIDYGPGQRYRSEVGAHVVSPGDTLAARVTLRNRGTLVTDPARLLLAGETADTVPGLAPGEEYRAHVDLVVPTRPIGMAMVEYVTVALQEVENCCWEDAESANNRLRAPAYHILVPHFSAQIILPDTIRALEPYHVTIRLTNESPFVAQHEAMQFGFCFSDDGYYCPEPAGGVVSVPPVMAGETRTLVARLIAPHESLPIDWVDQAGISPCFLLPDRTPEELAVGCVPGGRSFHVLPNVEASCNPRVLEPPAAFDPAEGNPGCRHQSDHYWQTIVALDAQADEVFGITAGNEDFFFDLTIVDLDANRYEMFTQDGELRFRAPRTGRYYLAARRQGLAEGNVLVTPIP